MLIFLCHVSKGDGECDSPYVLEEKQTNKEKGSYFDIVFNGDSVLEEIIRRYTVIGMCMIGTKCTVELLASNVVQDHRILPKAISKVTQRQAMHV